jgi:hypothetical protein
MEVAATPECESCGRSPARAITVRRHVGLLVFQQFFTTTVTACRPCGRRLIRSYTAKTLWQGWWGAISFFFNWFVLGTNAWAWKRLGAIENPSLSGMLVSDLPRRFEDVDQHAAAGAEEQPQRRSRLRRGAVFVLPAFLALGLIGWGWDATHHDHSEAHGAPATAAMIEESMTEGSFSAEDGTSTIVQQAACTGTGELKAGMYTHFSCQVGFDSGGTDEVTVHLLEGDDLLFISAAGSQP